MSNIKTKRNAKAPPNKCVFTKQCQPPQVVVNADIIIVIPLAGLVEPQKELDRLAKQKEKLLKQIKSAQGALNNKQFVAKAKPELVEARKEGLK